uniref:DBF4-type domain-containing protein n=1 Tax=Strongyloides venezuelensis TaxID=75913 RepID=A0A0K0FKD9_STRVS
MSLSGKCVTDLDTTETSNLTVSLIVTDHSKIIKNITKQERSIYLPSSLLKIKNFNNIPICPAHYFHSFLTTELMKKRQEICKPPISSNIIFLTSNFIKIQQRQNIERIKFCQKDTIDGFVKLNVFNNFLVSAFTKKTSKSLKHNMKKKSLKYEGYCEFCRIQTVNRFIHCDDKYHKYRINLNKKLFEELDREVGFFDDNFKNDLLYQFEK